jgi:hypothetical protein
MAQEIYKRPDVISLVIAQYWSPRAHSTPMRTGADKVKQTHLRSRPAEWVDWRFLGTDDITLTSMYDRLGVWVESTLLRPEGRND